VNIEIVKRSDHAKAFVVLPKRWVVERTFAWLGRLQASGVSPKIGRISIARRSLFSASLQSGSC
jgi:transposase